MAFIAVLAGPAVTHLFGVVGRTSHDHYPVVKVLLNAGCYMFLKAIHFHGWKEFTIGQLRQTIPVPINAGKLLNIAIPGSQVLIPDRPVYNMTIPGIGFKIQLTPPVTLTAPHQRTAADVIAADPVEALDFLVRVLGVLDEPVLRRLADRVAGPLLHVVVLELFRWDLVAARQVPRIHEHRRVVPDVLDVTAALQDEHRGARLRETTRHDGPAEAAPDYDDVERCRHLMP